MRCKSVPSGESLWSLEPRGQFYLQKNSCEIIPHKLTHSHTKTHTHRPFMPCLKRALGRSKVKSVSKRLAKQSSRGRWFWLAHHALFCRSDTHTRTQLHAKLLAWREERLMSRKTSPVRFVWNMKDLAPSSWNTSSYNDCMNTFELSSKGWFWTSWCHKCFRFSVVS